MNQLPMFEIEPGELDNVQPHVYSREEEEEVERSETTTLLSEEEAQPVYETCRLEFEVRYGQNAIAGVELYELLAVGRGMAFTKARLTLAHEAAKALVKALRKEVKRATIREKEQSVGSPGTDVQHRRR